MTTLFILGRVCIRVILVYNIEVLGVLTGFCFLVEDKLLCYFLSLFDAIVEFTCYE